MSLNMAIIGPSDITAYERHGLSAIRMRQHLHALCNALLADDPTNILTIVPYKGVAVEAAIAYRGLGGEVHGVFDDSLARSGNFAANKRYCLQLSKCPPGVIIDDYLVSRVDCLLALGISAGTMKELLANSGVRKPAFLFSECVSCFPRELADNLNVTLVDRAEDVALHALR